MTAEDRERLRSYTDNVVRMSLKDGEKVTVKVLLMMDEYDDVICNVLNSTRPEQYKLPLSSAAYTIPYEDIATFSLAEPGKSANGASYTSLGRKA